MKFLAIFLSASCVLDAAPTPAPSGGIIERQLEKEYEKTPRDSEKNNPDIQIDQESFAMPDDFEIYVDRIELRGNRRISSKDILKRLDPEIHKTLSLNAIDRLCRMIEALYVERGIAQPKAYPPPQKINDGILILEIRELSKSKYPRTDESKSNS